MPFLCPSAPGAKLTETESLELRVIAQSRPHITARLDNRMRMEPDGNGEAQIKIAAARSVVDEVVQNDEAMFDSAALQRVRGVVKEMKTMGTAGFTGEVAGAVWSMACRLWVCDRVCLPLAKDPASGCSHCSIRRRSPISETSDRIVPNDVAAYPISPASS